MHGTYPYSVVLFDVDGTLIDSAPGIGNALATTLTELGLTAPSLGALREWLGPPLPESFTNRLGLTGPVLEDALRIFRRRYEERGVLDCSPYAGVREVVGRVRRAGIGTATATSKVESHARLILTHFGVAEDLDVIAGASADERRSAKADIVEDALRGLAQLGADISRPVLVGDRHHDVLGAAAHGVPTIMATWGYGAPSEYEGAVAVADDPAHLAVLLGVAS